MEIKLLSPVNNATVSIMPKNQEELLASLPSKNQIIENGYDWQKPIAANNDYSKPEFVIFTWGLDGNLSEITDIRFFISASADFENADVYDIFAGQMFLSLTNFIYNKYYWKMAAYSDETVISESEVYSFNIANTLPRWFHIKGSTNVRDIGGIKTVSGHTVKPRMIYRGSELDRDFAASSSALKFMSEKLKIKTDLDLRKSEDLNKTGTSPIENATLINIPVLAYSDIFTRNEKDKYGKIFKLLSEKDNYPFYIHCIAGADRTGTLITLFLSLLDVAWDDIAKEYEFTSLSMFGMRSRYQKFFYDFRKAFELYGDTPRIRAENYLLSCGVSREEIQKIRDIMLEGESDI